MKSFSSIKYIRKMPVDQIQYSEKYCDDKYEYRHVILPIDLARHVPKTHLMTETEWRNLGVQQSPGWVHYMMHGPEPHVLLFRRLRTDLLTASRCTASQREQTVVCCN
ncbi:cyclin-dependent kinases regulatory subunit isoform X1 [Anoplolepis gracilipes]|uniref:cyclin-dependent kinases regulatory subunit isoform X1 n=2 Tax=Anoplolepis gracilipes TaxID=354296 RepID=UPI003B9EEDEA